MNKVEVKIKALNGAHKATATYTGEDGRKLASTRKAETARKAYGTAKHDVLDALEALGWDQAYVDSSRMLLAPRDQL
jgi:hypothetical protein